VGPGTCPHCGGANPYQAVKCQGCGAALLPSFGRAEQHPILPPVVPSGEDEIEGRPAPNVWFWVRVAVAVVILIFSIAIIANAQQQVSTPGSTASPIGSGPVLVTGINVSSPDDACGLDGTHIGGFQVEAYYDYTTVRDLPAGQGSVPCTVSTVSASTHGFNVTATLPGTATSADTPVFIMISPPAAFDGVLHLTFT